MSDARLCRDVAEAAEKAKKHANLRQKAFWFWESRSGFGYFGEVPDGVAIGNVRSQVTIGNQTRTIVPPNAP